MKVIRRGLFETNSSSTHSIVICSKETYESWKNGDLLVNPYEGSFYSKEEAVAELGELTEEDRNNLHTILRESDYLTHSDFFNDSYLHTYVENHTVKGAEIVAFGKYGFDG